MRMPSFEERARDVVEQLTFEVDAAADAAEALISEAISAETRRCLAWLQSGLPLAEVADHIEQYDEPDKATLARIEEALHAGGFSNDGPAALAPSAQLHGQPGRPDPKAAR